MSGQYWWIRFSSTNSTIMPCVQWNVKKKCVIITTENNKQGVENQQKTYWQMKEEMPLLLWPTETWKSSLLQGVSWIAREQILTFLTTQDSVFLVVSYFVVQDTGWLHTLVLFFNYSSATAWSYAINDKTYCLHFWIGMVSMGLIIVTHFNVLTWNFAHVLMSK